MSVNHKGRWYQWVLEPVKVIRRPNIAELIMASGQMPASKAGHMTAPPRPDQTSTNTLPVGPFHI